jgi:hypothetical protein
MHCPRCGQEVPLEVRFCKRCGLPLEIAKEMLLPTTTAAQDRKRRVGRAQKQGLFLIVACLLPFLLLMAESAFALNLVPTSLLLFIMMALAVAGLIRMLWPAIFDADTSEDRRRELRESNFSGVALPPVRDTPRIDNYTARYDDGVPPSVTEHTTKLLDDK